MVIIRRGYMLITSGSLRVKGSFKLSPFSLLSLIKLSDYKQSLFFSKVHCANGKKKSGGKKHKISFIGSSGSEMHSSFKFVFMIFFTHVTDFAEKDGLLVVHDFLNVC